MLTGMSYLMATFQRRTVRPRPWQRGSATVGGHVSITGWLQGLEDRVERLETWAGPGQIEALAEGQRAIRADIAKLQATPDRHEKLLVRLTHDVSGLQTDVAGLKTDVSGLKTDVAGLKTDVAGLKTDVAGLKTDVAGLKADVAGLKADVAVLKADVAELKADVSVLKADVAELKQDMGEVKATLVEILRRLPNLPGPN